MKKAERIDLSSSEDEICSNNLKEAIDQQFLNDNLYITRKTEFAPESKDLETNKSHGKSFRISSKQDQFTNFGVTDTFQNFIAKKLDEILEKTIKLKNSKSTECFMQQKQKRNKNSGIKLLKDSTLSKFQEAAIDPECILSKSDMIVWNSEYSKPEFQYKKSKDDILIEV
ncbi:uncharacterized protein LOC105249487 isoform X3 [Camponotus floridanus]|uniref:uncharacterized protein LOC105249487 isoform X3 n=1 Tax=Camponotus floridanus TaxID=104421 RepID=UPI00059BC170|nr:uncharacterized protein LOC105249487 isoform X3 [Camponotus floridanus]